MHGFSDHALSGCGRVIVSSKRLSTRQSRALLQSERGGSQDARRQTRVCARDKARAARIRGGLGFSTVAGEPGFEPRQTKSEVCCATVTPFPTEDTDITVLFSEVWQIRAASFASSGNLPRSYSHRGVRGLVVLWGPPKRCRRFWPGGVDFHLARRQGYADLVGSDRHHSVARCGPGWWRRGGRGS